VEVAFGEAEAVTIEADDNLAPLIEAGNILCSE
jgi:hypothetical protein